MYLIYLGMQKFILWHIMNCDSVSSGPIFTLVDVTNPLQVKLSVKYPVLEYYCFFENEWVLHLSYYAFKGLEMKMG